MAIDIAVSGDSILNRRVSKIEDERFHDAIQPFRQADIAFTHLETNLLEYDDPAAYPAAEAGGTWQRAPPGVADDLDWLGIDIVSHASNHALDYSYGGLRSTWDALSQANIPFAGTGRNLGDARSPAYLQVPQGRVGLVSMASTTTRWSQAGAARVDMRGRPGNNPMRYHFAVDSSTLDSIIDLAETFGWWVTNESDDMWVLNPSGLHNTRYKFVEDDTVKSLPHEGDIRGNLRSIRDAATRADYVVGHLHSHEFDPTGHIDNPAEFSKVVARDGIEAGADVFVVEGAHSPLRGIEIYEGSPIFYGPGDFFRMSDFVERLPADFYEEYAAGEQLHPSELTPSAGIMARKGADRTGTESGYSGVFHPEGGYHTGSTMGNVIPVCTFEGNVLVDITIHPGAFIDEPSPSEAGVPIRATGEKAEQIIADVAEKSENLGTNVQYENGVGVIDPR